MAQATAQCIPHVTSMQRLDMLLDYGALVYDGDVGAIFEGDGVTAGGVRITAPGSRATVATTIPDGDYLNVPNARQLRVFDSHATYGKTTVYGKLRVM